MRSDANESSPITGNRTIAVPLGAIVTTMFSLHLATLGVLVGWLWFLHQRTDRIPVMELKVDTAVAEIQAIRQGLGLPPPGIVPTASLIKPPANQP